MAPVRRVRLANGTPIYTTRFKWLQVANLGQTSGVRPTPHENQPLSPGTSRGHTSTLRACLYFFCIFTPSASSD